MSGPGPRVSIITPTYNHESFIASCITSVLAQTFDSWEQIVIDDGSTDQTAYVVAQFGDSRIRYIQQDHVGVWRLAETYNRALAASRGSLVGILEGDDLWSPEKLETLVPLLDRDTSMAYGRTRILLGSRPSRKIVPDHALESKLGPALSNDPVGTATRVLLTGRNFAVPCSVLISRRHLELIGGFRHVAGLGVTDLPTFLELSLHGRFAYVPRVVATWRRHPSAASWLNEETMAERAREYARTFMREHGLQRDEEAAIERAWDERLKLLSLQAGRALLLQAEWGLARSRFIQAMRGAQPPVRAAAVIGYLASYAHLNLERLAGVAGRLDLGELIRPRRG